MISSNPNFPPFIIGLTGPIGSGKSLVRKMLEHLGALTIDADDLAHEVYAPGNPGYKAVAERFGGQVLDEQGHIDRQSLGKLVFENHQALLDLEAIVHPLVGESLNNLLKISPLSIVAVEAIKLMESDLKNLCDQIWVVDAPNAMLIERLQTSRDMSAESIRSRLEKQADFSSLQGDHLSTILNEGSVISLWNKVLTRWEDLSLSDQHFNESLAWSKEIYQSFYIPLVQLSLEAAGDFDGQFQGLNSLEETFHFLCTHFIWEMVPKISGRNFIVSAINNRRMQILSISGQAESQHLALPFKMIEDFATLHLCTRVEIPYDPDLEAVFTEIGYDRTGQNDGFNLAGESDQSAVFRKVILPEMKLFWDSQE